MGNLVFPFRQVRPGRNNKQIVRPFISLRLCATVPNAGGRLKRGTGGNSKVLRRGIDTRGCSSATPLVLIGGGTKLVQKKRVSIVRIFQGVFVLSRL